MAKGFLSEAHIADLKKSGISDSTIESARADGWLWTATASETASLGYGTADYPVGEALAFEYVGVQPPLTRIKPTILYQPPWKEKPQKYLSPSSKVYPAGSRLYIPANLDRSILENTAVPLFITEGEKKAIKMTQDGYPCVALAGVSNWVRKPRDEFGDPLKDELGCNLPSEPIQDLGLINWEARRTYIIFDSDASFNEAVRNEEGKLADELGNRFADVFVVRLPTPTGSEADQFGLHGKYGAKFGCDDLLNCRSSGREDLELAVRNAAALGGGRHKLRLRNARREWPSIVDKFKSDAGYVWEPDVRGNLALVLTQNDADSARLEAALSKSGLGKRKIKELAAGVDLRVIPLTASPDVRTVRSSLNDPKLPELIIPDPFRLSNDGITINKETDDGPSTIRLSRFPVYISALLRDMSTGQQHFRVEWRLPNGEWENTEIERGAAMDARKVVSHASKGCPISSSDASAFVDYFKAFVEINHEQLPVARLTSHMGWQGENHELGFVAGSNFIRPDGMIVNTVTSERLRPDMWSDDTVIFKGADTGDHAKSKSITGKGTLEGWKEAVAPIAKYARPLLGLYASFVPPLLEILKCPNFIVSYGSSTTKGKTTSLRIAASAWGQASESDPSGFINTWDNTAVAIERHMALMNFLPVMVDETQRAKNPAVIKDCIYKMAQGQGRGRGSIKGLAATSHFRGVMFSSGEAPITSYTQDGGTRTRVIECTRPPFTPDPVGVTGPLIQKLEIELAKHHGTAGPAFVSFLIKNRDKWSEITDLYTDVWQQISTRIVRDHRTGEEVRAGAEVGRIAKYAAAICVAASLAHEALALPWTYKDPVAELWSEIIEGLSDAAGHARALEEIYQWASANQGSFFGRHETPTYHAVRPMGQSWFGKWEPGEAWDRICVLPRNAREVLEKAGYHANGIFRAWRDNGWTECDAGHMDTKKYRINGTCPRMIVILRSAVEPQKQAQ